LTPVGCRLSFEKDYGRYTSEYFSGRCVAAEKRNRQSSAQERNRPHQSAAQAIRRADHQVADVAARRTHRRSSAIPAPALASAAAPRATAAPIAQAARPAPAMQRAPVAAPAVSGLDQMLTIVAGAAGLFAIGTVIWLLLIPTT